MSFDNPVENINKAWPDIESLTISSEIEDIKDSIKDLTNLVTNINKDHPAYWSINRREDIAFWNFQEGKQEKKLKGWLCDIPYSKVSSEDIISYIKEKFECGTFDIILVDKDNKEISKRVIQISPEVPKKSSPIQLGSYLPKDHEIEGNAPLHITKDNREVLSYCCEDNQEAIFCGIFDNNIVGVVDVSIFWATTSWREGSVEWVVSFQAPDENGHLVQYSDVIVSKSDPGQNCTTKIRLHVPGQFSKNTQFRLKLSRCGLSEEDTLKADADVFYVMIDGIRTKKSRYVLTQDNAMAARILHDLKDCYEEYYFDVDLIIKNVLEKFENCANLRIKGGFIDLCALAEDLNIQQSLVVTIAERYITYQRGFLTGRLEISKYTFVDFGEVYILRRKRWLIF